jgi:uncharacterized protein (DUF2249 family)
MDTQIDKNIPVPDYKHGAAKYPFGLMEIGDSFFVATDRPGINSVRSRASTAGRRGQKRFSVRKVENGARIWRIE